MTGRDDRPSPGAVLVIAVAIVISFVLVMIGCIWVVFA